MRKKYSLNCYCVLKLYERWLASSSCAQLEDSTPASPSTSGFRISAKQLPKMIVDSGAAVCESAILPLLLRSMAGRCSKRARWALAGYRARVKDGSALITARVDSSDNTREVHVGQRS